jgi:hypothetical protein
MVPNAGALTVVMHSPRRPASNGALAAGTYLLCCWEFGDAGRLMTTFETVHL